MTRAMAVPAGNRTEVPRVLTFAVVKRIDPRLPNTWGHWWIELDGEQSYGWWPTPCPMGLRGAFFGTRGCLNGIGTADGGTRTCDAYHGEEPDHWFHPTLVAAKSDDQVRAEIRAFAQSYVGGFRWQWWWLPQPAENCRTFQHEMFRTVGLFEEPEYLYTQGPGCPFMFPFRRVRWRAEELVATAVAPLSGRSPRLRPRIGPAADALRARHAIDRRARLSRRARLRRTLSAAGRQRSAGGAA